MSRYNEACKVTGTLNDGVVEGSIEAYFEDPDLFKEYVRRDGEFWDWLKGTTEGLEGGLRSCLCCRRVCQPGEWHDIEVCQMLKGGLT